MQPSSILIKWLETIPDRAGRVLYFVATRESDIVSYTDMNGRTYNIPIEQILGNELLAGSNTPYVLIGVSKHMIMVISPLERI